MSHTTKVLAVMVIAAGLWLLNSAGAEPKGFLKNKPADLDVFYLNGSLLGSALLYLDSKPILSDPMLFSVYFDVNRDGTFDPVEELGVDAAAAFAEPGLPTGFPVVFEKAANPAAQLLALLSAAHRVPIRVVLSTLADPDTVVEVDE